jgi:hypothetical protein
MAIDNSEQRRMRFTAETKLKAIHKARRGVPVRQVCEKHETCPGQSGTIEIGWAVGLHRAQPP